MYGTIFNLDVKEGHEQQLVDLMANLKTPDGMVAWFVMKLDGKDRDLIGVAVFENKAAHVANANSPEQHATFTQIMQHLVKEPTWSDGEYIIGQVV